MQESEFEKHSSLRKVAEFVEEKQKESQAQAAEKPAERPRRKSVAWGEILKTSPEIPKTYFFHAITLLVSRIFFRLWYDIKIEGREHIKDGEPLIVAPNHQSLATAFSSPRCSRAIRYINSISSRKCAR